MYVHTIDRTCISSLYMYAMCAYNFGLQREAKVQRLLKDIAISLLKNVFIILHILIDKAVEAFYSWLWHERKTCVALRENFFITKSATDIAAIIRRRELTAYHVVRAYIQRLNEVQEERAGHRVFGESAAADVIK